jgi:hypothetical protein
MEDEEISERDLAEAYMRCLHHEEMLKELYAKIEAEFEERP